jgi:hypothetical protein
MRAAKEGDLSCEKCELTYEIGAHARAHQNYDLLPVLIIDDCALRC